MKIEDRGWRIENRAIDQVFVLHLQSSILHNASAVRLCLHLSLPFHDIALLRLLHDLVRAGRVDDAATFG